MRESTAAHCNNGFVGTLTYPQARQCVLDRVLELRSEPSVETVPLLEANGRVLARDIRADRDIPALARSVRDGFAVRASDFPGKVRVIGEVRAGERFASPLGRGEAIEIMTGASMPEGADAVIMVEHIVRDGEWITTEKPVRSGDFINPQGCEAASSALVLARGQRIGFAQAAMLAMTGVADVRVYARPRVAILPTGDEIVEVADTPEAHQIRNSNTYSIAAQVQNAGGIPVILPVARDNTEATRKLAELGLREDLLLLSGGVSAGKYDVVEPVLAEFGAQFYFDRVLIQPGQPLVFGRAGGRFFFGLPGNPGSTMVTFHLFARAAIQLLGGEATAPLPVALAPLTRDVRVKTGLTRFLPAVLGDDGALTPVTWSGSGDVPALARANAFLVTDPERETWKAGELIQVLVP